jgi:hypothetical protein
MLRITRMSCGLGFGTQSIKNRPSLELYSCSWLMKFARWERFTHPQKRQNCQSSLEIYSIGRKDLTKRNVRDSRASVKLVNIFFAELDGAFELW